MSHKIKYTLILVLCGCLLLAYYFFPRYISDFGRDGYNIMDGYAEKYYIECEGHFLLKKTPPTLTETDKLWLNDHLTELYNKNVKEFDDSGGFRRVIFKEDWVDGFKYRLTLVDDNARPYEDVYEVIAKDGDRYYRIEYNFPFKNIQYGRLWTYSPGTLNSGYSYDFMVGNAKKSCSNPQ